MKLRILLYYEVKTIIANRTRNINLRINKREKAVDMSCYSQSLKVFFIQCVVAFT
jgi:hypothetical protein